MVTTMSTLKTYKRRIDRTYSACWPLYVLDDKCRVKERQGQPTPGDMVCYDVGFSGRGMVIAINSDTILVLWACEPGSDADIEYVQKKLFAALHVPREYLGYNT